MAEATNTDTSSGTGKGTGTRSGSTGTGSAKSGSAKTGGTKSSSAKTGSAKTGGTKSSGAGTESTRPAARKDGRKGAATGSSASAPAKSAPAKSASAKSASAKSAPAKSGAKTDGKAGAAERPKKGRTEAEVERIRAALRERRDELHEEYDAHLAEIAELQRDRLTDSAGDDQADTGSKTFEREQEISLANSILERIKQVERALERLDEGSYGWCERCGDAIPVERLAAFPSATLCVKCKQLEERR